jgi:Flp pilus assembly protein TadB
MLCNTDTGYYSLGKSQMAFWGLLVVLSFSGVWILTGTMERIPPQILILLGISGATGLSAMVIGNNKKSAAQKKIKELQQEQPELAKQNVSDAVMARRKAIKSEIDSLPKQPEDGQSNSFWRDICDDGNGLSFHRFQVVLWTVVLGAVFVRAVAQVMSMPEFPDTLLTLLGISNATYLGFKIPEKQ